MIISGPHPGVPQHQHSPDGQSREGLHAQVEVHTGRHDAHAVGPQVETESKQSSKAVVTFNSFNRCKPSGITLGSTWGQPAPPYHNGPPEPDHNVGDDLHRQAAPRNVRVAAVPPAQVAE